MEGNESEHVWLPAYRFRLLSCPMSNMKRTFMSAPPPVLHSFRREVWLRRGAFSGLYAPGRLHPVWLSQFGNAAARETFATATPHMAAIWTDLFRSMTAPGSELRWRGDGPGIGRDARIAYSSLLGRYNGPNIPDRARRCPGSRPAGCGEALAPTNTLCHRKRSSKQRL